ncbi:MAG: hypothetical protein RQ801_01520 [Spirochaetaceae bacterium]|nr:hypothetical protein [Spirochaetaceae bacterium]MDT8296951.1 hypothetical protein [Spirochaetaceae bacterium]
MEYTEVADAVVRALDSRKPGRDFKEVVSQFGEEAAWSALDSRLGDMPDAQLLRKAAVALDLPEADLREKTDSPVASIRRLSRIVLLESLMGAVEDAQLHKGLSDSVARIRSDAARFVAPGVDRTRLYNQLIRLIREDPDTRVRAAAGRRLALSFADMYSVDFDGLPDLSKMLLLDALDGHTRIDEERAESLLLASKDPEAPYRAARRLLQWGTLTNLFSRGGSDSKKILERAAELGIVEFLTVKTIPEDKLEWALQLSEKANRQDLVREITRIRDKKNVTKKVHQPSIYEIEQIVMKAYDPQEEVRRKRISDLPLDDKTFKRSVEMAFPPPEKDISSCVLFDMARFGHWTDWTDRIIDGLTSVDPDVRGCAAAALATLTPERAASLISPLLTDTVPRVRRVCARALASIPSGNGCEEIAFYLRLDESDQDRDIIIRGVRDAGGAALAKCILDNVEELDNQNIGNLLEEGVDEVGAELLTDGFTTISSLKTAASIAGPKLGESFLLAWNSIDESSRKRVLSWIGASGWAVSASKGSIDEAKVLLKPLSAESRTELLETLIESAEGKNRRRLRKLMKN